MECLLIMDIYIVNSFNRDKIIGDVRNSSSLNNIKFMTFKEFISNYFFSYDDKTISYLMEHYNYDYDFCIKCLDSLYYLDKKKYSDSKLNKLLLLKEELINNNLLYFNNLFKDFLVNKRVVFSSSFLTKYEKYVIRLIKDICDVNVIKSDSDKYRHKYVYEFNDMEEEVSFVASSIVKLVNEGININDIKICGINDEYINTVKRIFSFYNISISINNNYLYATRMAKDYLNTLSLDYICDKYNMKNKGIIDTYNLIVNIVNKYVWIDNKDIYKKMVIHDFKSTKVNSVNYLNEVEVISSLEGYYDKYVFLMNFSLGVIPKIYMDDDYLSDKIREKLKIDTSYNLNKLESDKWLFNINSCRDIVISYKKYNVNEEYYISPLASFLKLESIHPGVIYNYSNIYNKIKLVRDIDELIKYNVCSEELVSLYNKYGDVDYMKYSNNYSSIDRDKFKKYVNNNLVLSYSAINNYYHCSFKYYLSNILKLNIYDDSFNIFIGNLFHHMLAVCFNDDIDINKEYNKFIRDSKYKFNSREKFFLDNLLSELIFVIDTIKEQYSLSSLKNYLYEEEIKVDKSREDMLIIFKGFIDKLILDNDNKVGAIVDYKTGNVSLDLNNCLYGIDMQLPVYVYLTKYKFPSIRIVGFYLQKILNSKLSSSSDKLKLQGYTNSDEELIKMFDSSYVNSSFIKGMKKSSKGLSSKRVFDDYIIDNLVKFTDDKINNVIDKVMEVNFDINPKRINGNDIGCMYCKYKDICYRKEEDVIYCDDSRDLLKEIGNK